MRVVVVTIAAGRHTHLAAQRAHLAALPTPPEHVVVAMGDPQIADGVGEAAGVHVVEVPAPVSSGPSTSAPSSSCCSTWTACPAMPWWTDMPPPQAGSGTRSCAGR